MTLYYPTLEQATAEAKAMSEFDGEVYRIYQIGPYRFAVTTGKLEELIAAIYKDGQSITREESETK